MQTFLLHLGYPKTGTTTLQATLFTEAPGLNFFAKLPNEYVPQSVQRFRTLVNYGTLPHVRNHGAKVLEDMLSAMAKSPEERVLLSLEGFTNPFVDTDYTLPKDIFRKINDIYYVLAPLIDMGTKIKILVTVRKQSELLPSLFSQIYLQGFSSGLFGPSYHSFIDFMLNDENVGFGPDFNYAAFLDHCAETFGSENVYASSMKGIFSQTPCRDITALSEFMELTEEQCIAMIGSHKLNVRNTGKRKGRRMMVNSPGLKHFESMTGLSMMRQAFSLPDRLRIRCGMPVHWQLPDLSEAIDDYYSKSNKRLAETHGILF